MGGSKMSKTEYDLKGIMHAAHDTPHKLQYKGKLKYLATYFTT